MLIHYSVHVCGKFSDCQNYIITRDNSQNSKQESPCKLITLSEKMFLLGDRSSFIAGVGGGDFSCVVMKITWSPL